MCSWPKLYNVSHSEYDCQFIADTVDPEIFALNILRLLIFCVVLFSSLEHTDENKTTRKFCSRVHVPDPGTGYHVAPWRHWREAGASDQRQRGNAADTHAVSLVERELPSATYLERFHPSVSVRGSNCLQKFASAIARLGWYRRAQRSSRIRNTIDRFLVAQQNHACTSIHENSHVK